MKYATSTSHRVSLVFSFKFWLVTVLLVLIYTSMLFAQYTNTIYLDPTNSGDPDQDGTIEHPFDHIADVTLSDNTDYLFNRGTQMDLTATINLQSSGIDAVRFRAYGSGDRPILYMSDQARDIFIIQGNKNIIIDSLHLLNYDTETGAVRGIEISPGYGSMPNTENVTISNCEIESGYVGINVQHGDGDYYTENLTISNCEIHHVGLDGIMIRDVTNGLIIGCNIHNVNQLWHTTTHTQAAGGDGIQIGHNCDSLKIYNNIVDRRTTGNKFALLLGNLTNVTEQCYTEIIGNTFYPPKDTIDDNGGVAVMFQDAGGAPNKVLFARNKIIGRKDSLGNSCQSAFRGDADTLYFYYNIIDSCNFNAGSQRITTDCDYTEIYNNVFMGGAISSTNVFGVDAITAIVKNNLSAGNTIGDPLRLAYVTNLEESNNLEIKSSNTSLYNSYLSITDWETSDFTRTSNLNDGAEVGLEYDLDSIPLGNPPEIGVCEFIEGGQTNTPPIINNQAFSIEENTINGTQVGMIIATDPDQGQTLTYSILSGNTDNAFQVNSTTGELTVNNNNVLDYETTPTFTLTVQVQDNGMGSLTDQAIVTVNLMDVNEAPEIEDQVFSLEENSQNNLQVGMVQANDPDNGQTLTYSILAGNIDNAFQINELSGRLSVNNVLAIDYETNPEFYLSIQVQDNGTGSLTDQAIITISLIDLNEIPEIEDQVFSVVENSPNNQQVGVVQASDPDIGQTLTYSILSGNTDEAFLINENTGELIVNNSIALDYETNPEFNLSIQVQDNGSGSLTNQATITIFIVDINEPPYIPNQEFTVQIDINLEADINNNELNIGYIQASDPDIDIGQSITFSILAGNYRNAFSLNNNTGELKISDPYALCLFEYFNYPLIVMVQDNSPEQLQASATVNVYVNIDTVSFPDRASELLLNKVVDKDLFSMKVYPNPVWNYFEIELENLEPGSTSILIFNTGGELISRKEIYCDESKYIQKYNVDNFRKGLYLIQIRNNSTVYYSKIVKM